MFAYVNVGLAIDGKIPAGLLGYGLGLGLLAGVAHLVVRQFAPYADPLLLPLATLLNGLGLVLIWRLDQSSSSSGPRLLGRPPRQLMWSALGVALFIAVLIFLKDHRILQRYTYISMVVALVLLVAAGSSRLGCRTRRQDLDHASPASAPSSPASSRRSSSRSSSPAT